jgi:AcrR family transcriptional regulator
MSSAIFWLRGYQDASISALTEAMGIASPSLYAAFGSKAELFCEAADLYQREDAVEPTRHLQSAPTARESVERMLIANANLFTRRGRPHGCLLTLAASTCPDDDTSVQRYLQDSCRQRIAMIQQRLDRAANSGEPLPPFSRRELAEYYDTVVQGLAVRAHEGATRRSLHRTVDLAMTTWPVN